MIAVREALVNAVAHADYSQRGGPIRVAMLDDRLEIENPGLLSSGMTVKDMTTGVSRVRSSADGGEVAVHHHGDELFEPDLWNPAEQVASFRAVPEQMVHFGWAHELLTGYDEVGVVQPNMVECYLAELPHGVGFPRRQHEVDRFVMLQDRHIPST